MGFLRRRQPGDPTSGSPADADDLLACRAQNDPRAFAVLYDRYFAAVYGYCLGELRDPEAAADAAGQTFLKALAALGRYRANGRFRGWLFAIAHNEILDALRSRRPVELLGAANDVADPTPTPEEATMAAVDVERLEAAIGRLPAADRRVLELRRAGLSGQEIATVLGIAHEAAKKRQLRAMDRLRTDLQATTSGPGVRRGA